MITNNSLEIHAIFVIVSMPLLKLVNLLSREAMKLMRKELITTEPMVLKMDKEVMKVFEKVGLLRFFHKILSFNESISI